MSFYLFSYLVISARIFVYSFIIQLKHGDDQNQSSKGYSYALLSSTFFKICLGFTQLCSMAELTIRLKYNMLQPERDIDLSS